MNPHREAIPTRACNQVVDTVVFFVMFFIYIWLVVDPRLVHHGIGVFTASIPFSFSTGWPFFREHLSRPGGLAEYAARWLSQWYSFGWAGALIITAAAWCTCTCADVLTRVAGRPRGMMARYVPAVLLLVIWGGYSHPLRPVLSLLAALACFAFYLPLARPSAASALVVLIVVCVGVYLVAGAGGLLFPVLVAVYELLVRRRWLVAVTAVLGGLGVPWAMGMTFFGRGIDEAYGGFFVSVPGVPAWARPYVLALYLFFPAALAVAALLAWRGRRAKTRERPSPGRVSSRIRRVLGYVGRGRRKWAIQTAAVLLAAGAAGWLSLDAQDKVVLLVDYYSQREMWPEVLKAADRLPYGLYNVGSNRNVMLALYHTGRLGDAMFRYPHIPGVDLYIMPEAGRDGHSYFQESRLFLELGQVNRAERCACEALESAGDLPAILEHLAVINIVKDRPETARMFLTALSKKPFHGRAARKMLHRLEEDRRLESDPRIRRIRRSMVRVDSAAPQPVEELLLTLLRSNPRNKMAFEFLMAHYLSTGRPDKVVQYVGQPMGFEYRRLPRHFQEAIVVHSMVTDGRLPPAQGPLDPEVIHRAAEFCDVVASHGGNEEAARKAASAAGFGDSYFFFYRFGVSGL
ncbi:MAG TPA: DUF6057 family protein [Thermoguttaceae bacterium]|nr:DUF6057 family protein [Thermoguttaceae bacterium]